ncbi:MAG TPA: TolC family protein [Chitinophagaceae bacterium]|nr:TolC family protein [Chitinophagaceae bacterium]
MSKNKLYLSLLALVVSVNCQSQIMTLRAVIDSIRRSHPAIRMYESEIRSMDEAAKGARAWMPTQLGFGQFMTPYNVNMWKKNGDENGMGSVMISGEQMFPNKKKLDADEAYMKAMSSVEKERKNATLNELISDAKLNYYQWIFLEKRISVLKENEKILDFMIKNAEIRYKNNMEKISAYYKAKAALGTLKNMQLMYNADINEKRIRINSLMNRNALAPLEIDTNYKIQDYKSVAFDSSLFYANRSDLRALDRDIDLSMLKVETEKQGLKPQFGVRYDHMFGLGGSPMLYTLMGMMRIPLVNGAFRMNKANIESLKWKADALQARKEMMVNEFSGMAYGMRNELDLKLRQLEVYEKDIIPALKNNYMTMQLGYEQNTEELFMLYDAWERLNMTQMEYLEILDNALKLQVTIERLIEKE